MKIKSFRILNVAFVLTLFACSSPQTENKSDSDPVIEEPSAVIEEPAADNGVFYQVPTPNELFAVLKNSNTAYNKDILNSIDNIGNYTSKGMKALNFGVYAADLAYVSSLGHIEDASKIFETIRTLSKELEITAETNDGIIMGVKHKKYNIHGVQFHPESIKTTIGIKILKNFINYKN